MSNESKPQTQEQQPQDDRPAYEPPQALRLSDTQAGAGACVSGYRGVGNCMDGNDPGVACWKGSRR